jgi:hypothetical protein
MWWLRRQWERAPGSQRQQGEGGPGATEIRGGSVIDADYEVISRRDED